MKILTKITIGFAASALLALNCNGANVQTAKKNVVKPSITEADLGYRGTNDLLKENVVPPKVAYKGAAPGAAKKIDRSFQDAPPLIPHSTKGLLPITGKNNSCLGCHMPAQAKAMGIGATPIPVSHFTNFRPATAVKGDNLLKNGKAIKNTSSVKLANVSIKVDKGEQHVDAGRYNCTQCHVPQSASKLVDSNSFKAVYDSKNGAHKSSWNKSKWMNHINTMKSK